MNTLADEDAVLQELGPYLGIEKTEREPIMPSTIQKYHKMVASNNQASVFDDIYRPESASCNSAQLETNDSSVGLFTDKKIIRVQGGRGNWKTGKKSRITFKHSESALPQVGLDSEELIQHQLRKVNPTGYSNEVTENSVRQNRRAKSQNQSCHPADDNSPGELSSSSISSHYSAENSTSNSPATVTSTGSSSISIPRRKMPIPDKKNVDKPGAICSSSDLESRMQIFDNDTLSLHVDSIPFIKPVPNKPAENINKAKPITEILSLSRKQYKYRKSQQLELTKEDDPRDDHLATMKKIQEILHQDAEEERQRKINVLAAQSPNLSWTGRTDCPSWQSYSNPYKKMDKQSVNIKSISDFPPLN